MKKSTFKKLYKEHGDKVTVEVMPRRWKYIVKISHLGRVSILNSWFTKKPIYFDNLDPVNQLMKKIKITNYKLVHNCPHTEICGLDAQENVSPERNDAISVSI